MTPTLKMTVATALMISLCFLCGCATPITNQIPPRPNTPVPPPDKCRVTIERKMMTIGKYNTVDIQVNGNPVGSLGNGGDLTWDAEPGPLNITAIIGGLAPWEEVCFTDFLTAGRNYCYTWSWEMQMNDAGFRDLIKAQESEVPRIAPYRETAISNLRRYRVGITLLSQLEQDFATFPNWVRETSRQGKWGFRRTIDGTFVTKATYSTIPGRWVDLTAPDGSIVWADYRITYRIVINKEYIADLCFEEIYDGVTGSPRKGAVLKSCRLYR